GGETGIVENGRVVDAGGDPRAVLFDRRDGSIGSCRWELHGPSRFVDVAALLGEPVADDQRRIPERPGQPLAEWARRRSLAEVDYEPGDSGLRPPPPEQVREQRDGHETDHQVIGDERRTAAVHVGEAGYCT